MFSIIRCSFFSEFTVSLSVSVLNIIEYSIVAKWSRQWPANFHLNSVDAFTATYGRSTSALHAKITLTSTRNDENRTGAFNTLNTRGRIDNTSKDALSSETPLSRSRLRTGVPTNGRRWRRMIRDTSFPPVDPGRPLARGRVFREFTAFTREASYKGTPASNFICHRTRRVHGDYGETRITRVPTKSRENFWRERTLIILRDFEHSRDIRREATLADSLLREEGKRIVFFFFTIKDCIVAR